jgi:hypothetical protein
MRAVPICIVSSQAALFVHVVFIHRSLKLSYAHAVLTYAFHCRLQVQPRFTAELRAFACKSLFFFFLLLFPPLPGAPRF